MDANRETKLLKLFIHATFYTIIAFIMPIPGLILLDPCLPPFLLSVRDDCSSITWSVGVEHLSKFAVGTSSVKRG